MTPTPEQIKVVQARREFWDAVDRVLRECERRLRELEDMQDIILQHMSKKCSDQEE